MTHPDIPRSIRRWLEERGWYGSVRNLNRNQLDLVKGSILRHGRLSLHAPHSRALYVEWYGPDPRIGGRIRWSENLHLSVHAGLVHLHLSVQGLLREPRDPRTPRLWRGEKRYYGDRELSVQLAYDRDCITPLGVYYTLWTADDDLWEQRPRWRHGVIWPFETLFGAMDVQWRDVRRTTLAIPLPERTYTATAVYREGIWTWRRLPFYRKRLVRVEVTPDLPIPYPGKGENSWDGGERGMEDFSGPYQTDHEAVGAIVQTILRDRMRYGGADWQPAEFTES